VINLIIFLLFVILLFLGVPVGFALLIPSVVAFAFYPEIQIQLLGVRLTNAYMSSSLLALPLFIFAAQILSNIQITDSIFNFVNKCVGYVRGGLAHVNVFASIIFAGMSGSAAADAAGLGKVEIEAMGKQGYPKAYSAALTAASSTIGPIAPPSIPAIIYGSIAGVSIGKLLIGGFLPACIMAIMLCISIFLVAKRRGFPKTKFVGFKQIYKDFWVALPGMMTPIILIGGMLFGFFTPTEAATVAVVYAIIIGFCLKNLTFKGLWQSFKQSALDTAIIMCGFLGATLIGLLVTRLHLVDATINFISGVTDSPLMVLMLINIILLVAGCFIDTTPCIFLFTPIFVPLTQKFGIDPIHLGIIMILNIMIGSLTPPMGGLLFITCKVADLSLQELLKEIWPFIVCLMVALMIVTCVPQTVLWLPNLFIK
jgi:tripartite ATP-independent transporter DctM subunit